MTAAVVSVTKSETFGADDVTFNATMPGTTVAGELLLALIAQGLVTGGTSYPAVTGWTKNFEAIAAFDAACVGWSKTATGSDGATQTFTCTASKGWNVGILRINAHNGIDVYGDVAASIFDDTINSPSVNTTVPDCLVLVGVVTQSDSDTITPPGSTTLVFEETSDAPVHLTVYSFVQASAGATGAKTWTSTAETFVHAFTIAIAPAAGGGGGNSIAWIRA